MNVRKSDTFVLEEIPRNLLSVVNDVTIACRRPLHGLLEQNVAVRVEDGAIC